MKRVMLGGVEITYIGSVFFSHQPELWLCALFENHQHELLFKISLKMLSKDFDYLLRMRKNG